MLAVSPAGPEAVASGRPPVFPHVAQVPSVNLGSARGLGARIVDTCVVDFAVAATAVLSRREF